MSVSQAEAPPTTAPERARPRPSARREPSRPRQWNVVLIDDDEHTYEYVMRMAQGVFGRSQQDAWLIAVAVDVVGRAVLLTTHREHAELKREQAISCGRDPLVASCAGPMTIVLEPVDEAGDGESRE